MSKDIPLTGVERYFAEDEIIVSKTDLKGRIVYGNDVFLRLAGYGEKELIGQPHSIIRHPDMPRCVFKLLWDTIGAGQEIFAYVINRSKNGDHYWVFAHVTPTYDVAGNLVGYHSSRRVPEASALATIKPLYGELKAIEDARPNRKEGMRVAFDALVGKLNDMGKAYDEFVLAL
jgi:PAS domain S-box-containing protein